jgi:hypothetical protein
MGEDSILLGLGKRSDNTGLRGFYESEKEDAGIKGGERCRVRKMVSIHGVVELVEIPNNKSQMTNKYQ